MYQVNPNQLIAMIKRGYNPQQLLINVLESNMKGTPMGDNLINLAKSGNVQGIEEFARNYVKQNGKDFDQEFSAFRQNFGL